MYQCSKVFFLADVCQWEAQFPAVIPGGPYNIEASHKEYGIISISNVLFGDVWICSGEANMEFTVSQVSTLLLW